MSRWVGVFSLGILSLVTGCSLVSGWTDLQGGAATKTPGGDDDDTDASVKDGATPKSDGNTETKDSGPFTPSGGVHCGSARCATGEICCTTGQNTLVCSTKDGCTSLPLPCTTRADCPTGQACCFGSNDDSSACKATCDVMQMLCNTSDPTACPAGSPCAPIASSLPNFLFGCGY